MYTAEPHKSYRVEGKQFFFSRFAVRDYTATAIVLTVTEIKIVTSFGFDSLR